LADRAGARAAAQNKNAPLEEIVVDGSEKHGASEREPDERKAAGQCQHAASDIKVGHAVEDEREHDMRDRHGDQHPHQHAGEARTLSKLVKTH